MKVRRFGTPLDDSKGMPYFVEDEDGRIEYDNMDIIHEIWIKWVSTKRTKKYIEDDYLIFEFKDPI